MRGIVDKADVRAGKVKIIAPEGFTEHAVSENVIAGNAMSRRAVFMYGALLPRNERGIVNSGLGQSNFTGTAGLIVPTDLLDKTGTAVTVDGIKMVFQMTPGTEAAAEMNTFFPQLKAMWMVDNSTNTMHNILTPRGAQVHDALKWAHYLNETIELYGKDVEVKFQSHHWPQWDNANPSDLNNLPPEPAARKYVQYMGVEAAVLKRTGADFARGEYRCVATALKHVVFANPKTQEQGRQYPAGRFRMKEVALEQAVANGGIKIEGKPVRPPQFIGLLDSFPFWFNIVTPNR